MTYGQMYDFTSQSLLDKGGDAYMPNATFDELASAETATYCNNLFDEFQKTQKISDKLAPITVKFNFSLRSAIVPTTDLVGYWHLLPMQGYSVYSCNGVNKSNWFPIKPLSLSSETTIDSNAFNKVSERNIYSVETNDLITIKSLLPLDIRGTYLKYPNAIDSENNPTTQCQFSKDVCEHICKMVAEQYWLTLGNPTNVQMQGQLNQQEKS